MVIGIVSHQSSGSVGQGAGAFVGADLHSLVVDPTNSQHLYVGGHESATVSRDGGRTFQQISGLQNSDAMAWSVAANGRDQVVSGHNGLRTSADGGATWTDLTDKLPASDVHAVGLDPATPQHLWADVVGRGVYASTDGGRQWQMAGGGSLSLMGPIIVSAGGRNLLAADMSNQSVVRSTDGGQNWTAGATSIMASWLSADPADPRHLLAAGGGISESLDAGDTWRTLSAGPANATTVAFAADPKAPLVSAALDGDRAVVYRSGDHGVHWDRVG